MDEKGKKLTVEDLLRLRDGDQAADEYLDVPAYSGSSVGKVVKKIIPKKAKVTVTSKVGGSTEITGSSD